MQLKFIVELKQGRIVWNNKLLDLWNNNLKSMGDREVELIVRTPQKPKSDQQRKYYWGCLMKIVADETGMDPLEVHAYCKEKFLPHNIESTEVLSTVEEEEYHTKIRQHFDMEFNIILPLPNQVDY